jgi:hypothetical protein
MANPAFCFQLVSIYPTHGNILINYQSTHPRLTATPAGLGIRHWLLGCLRKAKDENPAHVLPSAMVKLYGINRF